MAEQRRQIRLGEVFEAQSERLGPHEVEPPVLSLSKYDGLVLASDYFDKRIASERLNDYKVVLPDGWAYSTIHIDEGSIARNTLGVRGVISPMYTTLSWVGKGHDPRYFELLLRSPQMLATYRDHAQGSINRRRSLPFKVFADLEVEVPSLDEQRRIVDLIGAVDGAMACALAAGQSAGVLLGVHLDSLTASSFRRLGDLMSIGSGSSWKSDQEHAAPVDGGHPVIGITNTRPDGRLDLTERRYVVGLATKVRVLTDQSLIMIRTNGNRQRIGNIYRTTPEAVGSAVSAFQIAMEPTEDGIAGFLYWVLRRPEAQSLISEAASGSTGLGNVAVKWLRELELPWPEDSEQREFVEVAEALLQAQEASEDEASALRQLRSALLDRLLSGDRVIPESYDVLLESV